LRGEIKMRKIIFYIVLIIFIFVAPHKVNETNLLALKTVLVVLFFVAPFLKMINVFGDHIEKPIKKFKELDNWKNDKGGGFYK